MKYKAYEEATPGSWFINTYKKGGQQYGKRFPTELQAKQTAALWNMQEAQVQVDKHWRVLYEMSEQDDMDRIKLEGRDSFSNQGDFLC